MFRITAYYGKLAVSYVTVAEDIEAATINGELAFNDADLLVVETATCREVAGGC